MVFNFSVEVPDELINDFKQMIDDRLSEEYNLKRITPAVIENGVEITPEVVIGYRDWIEMLIRAWLRNNFKGWKKDQLEAENKATLDSAVSNIIVE